jgi:hypothetical protein
MIKLRPKGNNKALNRGELEPVKNIARLYIPVTNQGVGFIAL